MNRRRPPRRRCDQCGELIDHDRLYAARVPSLVFLHTKGCPVGDGARPIVQR